MHPFRERLVRAMRDRGYEATGVADHPAAIDAAREESPELALVDLRLPGESGLAVVRDLKALDSVHRGGRADRLRKHRHGGGEHEARRRQLSDEARRRRSDRRGFRGHATTRRTARLRRSLASSGSTFNGFSRTAAATCRRRPESWEFTGGRSSGSSRSGPYRVDPFSDCSRATRNAGVDERCPRKAAQA